MKSHQSPWKATSHHEKTFSWVAATEPLLGGAGPNTRPRLTDSLCLFTWPTKGPKGYQVSWSWASHYACSAGTAAIQKHRRNFRKSATAKEKNITNHQPVFHEKEATTTRTKEAQNIQTQRTFTKYRAYDKIMRSKFVHQDLRRCFRPVFENYSGTQELDIRFKRQLCFYSVLNWLLSNIYIY